MWDYSDGIKEQTEERPNAALGDRLNLIVMLHSGLPGFVGCAGGAGLSRSPRNNKRLLSFSIKKDSFEFLLFCVRQ